MIQYKPDIFYDSTKLDLDTKRKILLVGLTHYIDMRFDIKKKVRRVRTNKFNFADFYNDLTRLDFFGIKEVRSYEDPYFGSIMVNQQIHDEDVYMWIDMDLKKFNRHIVNKFSLVELK